MCPPIQINGLLSSCVMTLWGYLTGSIFPNLRLATTNIYGLRGPIKQPSKPFWNILSVNLKMWQNPFCIFQSFPSFPPLSTPTHFATSPSIPSFPPLYCLWMGEDQKKQYLYMSYNPYGIGFGPSIFLFI